MEVATPMARNFNVDTAFRRYTRYKRRKMMNADQLSFDTRNRYWSTEREAINFFARHDGVEVEFIVSKDALVAVGHLAASLNEESALLTFDNYEDLFLDAAIRVWTTAGDSRPVYFINGDDVSAST